MRSDEQTLAELGRAAEGLFYMSESDYPFELIRLEGAGEITPERLRALARAADDARVEIRSLEEFFGGVAAAELRREGGELVARPASFQHLVRTLTEHLTDTKVYKVGEINIPVLILGRSGSGNWLGLSTRVVET